jgi:hypothetical protein
MHFGQGGLPLVRPHQFLAEKKERQGFFVAGDSMDPVGWKDLNPKPAILYAGGVVMDYYGCQNLQSLVFSRRFVYYLVGRRLV